MESSVVCEEVVWSTGQAWCVYVCGCMCQLCERRPFTEAHSRVEMDVLHRTQ